MHGPIFTKTKSFQKIIADVFDRTFQNSFFEVPKNGDWKGTLVIAGIKKSLDSFRNSEDHFRLY